MMALTPQKIEAVLAHELGRFKLRHILKRSLANFIISLGVLALFGWIRGQSWLYEGVSNPTLRAKCR